MDFEVHSVWGWYSCACQCPPIKDYWRKIKEVMQQRWAHTRGILGLPSRGNQKTLIVFEFVLKSFIKRVLKAGDKLGGGSPH